MAAAGSFAVVRIGVLASAGAASSRPSSPTDMPVEVVVVDRPCGATTSPRPPASTVVVVARTSFAPTSTGPLHRAGRRGPAGSRGRAGGDGRVHDDPREAPVRRLRRRRPQHPPGAAARSRGAHGVRDALAAGVEGHRHHGARRHPGRRRRTDPRPGARGRPARRHRRLAPRAHQGGRARALPRNHPPDPRKERGPPRESALSVYDKTGIVELAAAARARLRPRVQRRDGEGDRRRRAPGHRHTPSSPASRRSSATGRVPHPRVHGGILADPTDEAHRADMADPRDRGLRPRRRQRLPVRQRSRRLRARRSGRRMDVLDIGGPDDPGGQEPRPRRRRHRSRRLRRGPRRAADAGPLRRPPSPPGRAFAFTAAYDAGIVAWFDQQAGETPAPTFHGTFTKAPIELRYGENPHQAAAIYRSVAPTPGGHVTQHGGWR